MLNDRDIDRLCEDLHAAGLTVGVTERLRARHVLGTFADLSNDQLRHVLAAIFVKGTTGCTAFAPIFDQWVAKLAAMLPPAEQPSSQTPAAAVAPALTEDGTARLRPGSRRKVLRTAFVAGALLVIATGSAAQFGVRRVHPSAPSKQPAVDLGNPDAADLTPPRDVAATPPSAMPSPNGGTPKHTPKQSPNPKPPPPPKTANSAATERPDRQLVWVPSLSVLHSGRIRRTHAFWLSVALAALAAALSLSLRNAFLSRRYLPDPASRPSRPGPLRIVPEYAPEVATRTGPGSLHLLSPREEETLVWGIGQFVSDQPTRQLNVPQSVLATARSGGHAQLRFHNARHDREVWLWLDESAFTGEAGGELLRLAREIRLALYRAGLPEEAAHYWGVPEQLSRVASPHADAEVFAPNEVEERKGTALVALLTDGEVLAAQLAGAGSRDAVASLLRSLSHWPNLCFVDFGRGVLAALLDPYGIPVLAPRALSGFLGGRLVSKTTAAIPDQGGAGEVRAWAAACALSPFAVEELVAFHLRDQLGLGCSPWELRWVRTLARCPTGAITFPRRERAALLAWLRDAESRRDRFSTRGAVTLHERALKFWRDLLEAEDRRRRLADAQSPWLQTPAAQHLLMQRALIDLWDRPESAIVTLYALFMGGTDSPLRAVIGRELSFLLPSERRDCLEEGRVALPWRLIERTAPERIMLQQLGFGGTAIQWHAEELRRPTRPHIGIALAMSVAVMAAITAVHHRHPPVIPPIVTQEFAPPEAKVHVDSVDPDYRVTAAGTLVKADITAAAGDRVTVRWQRELFPCWHAEADGSRTYICDVQPCPYREITDQGLVYVRVCAGEFMMGAKDAEPAHNSEKPAHRVQLKEYWIGKYEVSNAQFLRFAPQQITSFPGDDIPIDVPWVDAQRYCAAHKARLPTEAEWEYAARGTDGRKYPWGSATPDGKRAVFRAALDSQSPQAVISYFDGAGPFGTLHQAGNIREWVADCFVGAAYQLETNNIDTKSAWDGHTFLQKPLCDHYVNRGGDYRSSAEYLSTTWRASWLATIDRTTGPSGVDRAGLRCVRATQSSTGAMVDSDNLHFTKDIQADRMLNQARSLVSKNPAQAKLLCRKVMQLYGNSAKSAKVQEAFKLLISIKLPDDDDF